MARSLWSTKVGLYLASWFSLYLRIQPYVRSRQMTSTSDLWRVSLSPYETTSWQALVFVMPVYFLMFLIPKERAYSTCYTYLYLCLVSKLRLPLPN